MFANIVKPIMGIVGERFLYASSLGFCIIIAYFIFRLLKLDLTRHNLSYKYIIVLIIILIPYSAKTISRNKAWKDYFTLYSNDIKYLEKSVKANDLFASELLKQVNLDIHNKTKDIAENKEKIQLAIKHYKQALKVYPEHYSSLNNLGLIYFVLFKQYDVAIMYFEKAIKTNPRKKDMTYFNLAYSYEMLNNYPQAIKYYKEAININPVFIRAKSNLANLYYKIGDFETSVKINEEIMKIDNNIDIPYINIGNYYLMKSDTITAISYMEKASEKYPPNYNLCMNLSRYFKQKGNLKKAEYYYDKAIKADNNRRLMID